MYLQMAKKLTEDAVRDKARDILGFKDKDGVMVLRHVLIKLKV